MKVLIKQFLGQWHSWSVVGWSVAESLIKAGHDVHLFPTDGVKHVPNHLKKHIIGYTELNKNVLFGRQPDKDYDMQFSYTAMINFPHYLSNGNKNRFGIWTYEWNTKNVFPNGFAKHYKSCDKILAPSTFSKIGFMNSGIPESSMVVIPHGITENYTGNSTIELPTKKKFKILTVLAQNHKRKNIAGLLNAYGKAFTNADDVCLIIKGREKPLENPFDVSLNDCINDFNRKYPKHAELKVYSKFIDDMSMLYRSADALYTMAFCEGFYMPGLEMVASGKLNIAPNWGGQLDFLNDSNALLVNGKEERADPSSMYWESKNNAIWFNPSIDDAVDKLRYAYKNYEEMNKKIELQRDNVYSQYSWDTITKRITDLCID
jgi:glycosyltransferase involved in cell wall biosynthesis